MSMEAEAPAVSPRADLVSACIWIVLGAAIALGSWQMDRLENLHINRYEIPGLVPGLLGATLAVLGVVLALRALGQGAGWRAGPPGAGAPQPPAAGPPAVRWPVVALAVGYAILLVGRGVPFWLATWVFVASFIALFDWERQRELGRGLAGRAAFALGAGAVVSAVVSLAFSEIFLVRLP